MRYPHERLHDNTQIHNSSLIVNKNTTDIILVLAMSDEPTNTTENIKPMNDLEKDREDRNSTSDNWFPKMYFPKNKSQWENHIYPYILADIISNIVYKTLITIHREMFSWGCKDFTLFSVFEIILLCYSKVELSRISLNLK